MAKRRRKIPRSFYDGAKSSPRHQYDQFIRSPKADEPSEEVPIDYESESGQVVPVVVERGQILSYVPPAHPSKYQVSINDVLKFVIWAVGLAVLIAGILWGAFNIVHDVEDVKTSLSDIKNNEMKAIHDKLDKQEKTLNKLLEQREKGNLLQKESSKNKPKK